MAKPLIAIPRWKAPTWERTGYYLDALEDAGALLDDALARDIPVLAICRGHQLLNVALGGSLLQHIEDNAHRWLEDGDSSWHDIKFDGPSRLSSVYERAPRVNSRHHQGITPDRLAAPLRATAFAHEGYIESAESEAHCWVLGVQWHPERPEMRDDARPLFSAFVVASAGG